MKNGGTEGVSRGVKEAAKVIGWTLRVIDGQGEISGRTAALNQAIALKPDGIVVGGFDAIEQNAGARPASRRPASRSWAGTPTIEPGPDAEDRHVRQRQHAHRRRGRDGGRSRRSSIRAARPAS